MSGNRSEHSSIDPIAYCLQFSNLLEERREKVLEILTDLEPSIWANDEIDRSINCLLNIKAQAKYLDGLKIARASAYLPINQPLYAFVLNVFLLKLVSDKVYYRPPEKQRELHLKLYQLFVDFFENIEICCITRSAFFEIYVQNSDVVVFTGKYENARLLLAQLSPKTMLIYNGSALNPIIVTAAANIHQSVIGTINARLYNSGQDCMAPAGILVHESILARFEERLIQELATIKIGANGEPDVFIGPTISDACAIENRALIEKHKDAIIFGGKEVSDKLFTPTIFRLEGIDEGNQQITYAPFFFIQTFCTLRDIAKYLTTPTAKKYKGYISIFGNVSDANAINKLNLDLIILRNCTLFDYEEGNLDFGGYGEGCSFVSVNKEIVAKPILLLREIHDYIDTRYEIL